MARTIYNAVAYQVAWLAIIIGAAQGYGWAGALIALAVAAIHVASQRSRAAELKLIACAVAVGVAHETLLMQLGFVDFTPSGWNFALAPYWMVALWVAFATTFRHSLHWVMRRPWIAIAAGAVGGPLAYLAGARLGALNLADFAAPALAVTFALAMAVLAAACRHVSREPAATGQAAPFSAVSRPMLGVALLAPLLLSPQPARAEAERAWKFAVSLDGRPIGEHSYTLRDLGGFQELHSSATFSVKILFYEAYRYEHDARERWRDGCLERLDSRTDDNGVMRRVNATRAGSEFEIIAAETTRERSSCVRSFAYWNLDALRSADALLNPQTGEYLDVEIESLGPELLEAETVERFVLRATGDDAKRLGPIVLWYSAQREWIGLEATTPDGRRLRYSKER